MGWTWWRSSFSGGAKHRLLRVFIEKNAEERRKLLEANASLASEVESQPTSANSGQIWGTRSGSRVGAGVVEQLAGVTHEDCAAFSRDFGTVVWM
jgi:ribosome maturation factor RimP